MTDYLLIKKFETIYIYLKLNILKSLKQKFNIYCSGIYSHESIYAEIWIYSHSKNAFILHYKYNSIIFLTTVAKEMKYRSLSNILSAVI